MREEAGIIGTVLFLQWNCGSCTLVLRVRSVHFLIVLHNLHIYYIITYFLRNLGDDFFVTLMMTAALLKIHMCR